MLPTSRSRYRTFHYLPNISHSFQSISSPQLQPLTMAVLFFVSIDILEYHKIKSYSMWYSAPGFFHLAQCFWDSSILLHVLVVFVFVFVFDQVSLKSMIQIFRWSLFCGERSKQGSRGSLSLASLWFGHIPPLLGLSFLSSKGGARVWALRSDLKLWEWLDHTPSGHTVELRPVV